jgi:hypothetical protein
MKKLFIIILLISTFIAQSQTTPDIIFKNLKKGAVLVRLKTNANTINALKGKNDELMNRIISKRDKQNKEIIEAFEKNFTLCKVYYFYSNKSKDIANKNFKGNLLNADLQPAGNLPVLTDNYVIMEFSYIMQNTESTWSYSEWGVKDGKVQMIDYYSGGNEKGPDALIVLMPDFRLMPDKYPYFVRTYKDLLFLERSKAKTVVRMQNKIKQYLKGTHFK